MQFKEVIGQRALQKDLIKIVSSKRVHHTQLFLGHEGGGSLAFVLAYAQYLQCENRGETDSCGLCVACRKMKKLIHPDLHFTFPTITKRKNEKPISKDYIREFQQFVQENQYGDITDWLDFLDTKKRPNITARECLEIIKTARYKPVEGRYKINIIWMAEFLAKEGNRLLKILEEPPEHTIFLLIAEREELLLNTILSRSQIHRLRQISDQQIQDYLIREKSINPNLAKSLAIMADGNFNKAISLSTEQPTDYESVLTAWFEVILRERSKLVDFVSTVSNGSKEDVKNLFLQGTQICREALILRDSDLPGRMPKQEQKIAAWLGQRLSLQQIHQLSDLLEQAMYAVDRNANTNVLLMSTSLDIGAIIQQRETV